MQNTSIEERVSKIASLEGIEVYQIKTRKFKTNTINIFFHDSLNRENTARNALLPAVLRMGCEKFPTFRDIALHLEELYGASFDCGVGKKGERQIIQFYIDYISDNYTGTDSSLFENAFDLLYEILTKPVLENGIFKAEYVAREKENLKKLIEGRVNDKTQYAVDRCFEEMCAVEPYGIYEYGTVEDVEKIDSSSLYAYYRYFLESLPMQVFITGDIESEKIDRMIDKLSKIKRGAIKSIDAGAVNKDVGEVKNITEKMSVNQGKLSLGFRTNTAPNDEDYYSLMVFNTILGGGVHSKLFQNVREKASLAYYAFSRLEKFKGLMVISSGIEMENRDRAVDIILKQIDAIKEGNISDYEYDSTLKSIETGLKSMRDSQLQIVDFYLSQSIIDGSDTFDTLIEKVKRVSIPDVVKVAERIQLDTTYFLTGTGEQ